MSVCLDPNELLNKNQHSISIKNDTQTHRWYENYLHRFVLEFSNVLAPWILRKDFLGNLASAVCLEIYKLLHRKRKLLNHHKFAHMLHLFMTSIIVSEKVRVYVTVKSWCGRKNSLMSFLIFYFVENRSKIHVFSEQAAQSIDQCYLVSTFDARRKKMFHPWNYFNLKLTCTFGMKMQRYLKRKVPP